MRVVVRGVSFGYDSVPALEDVSLEAGEAEVVGIIGPNGSGKSTLLKCIDGILKPRVGVVLIDGKETERMRQREVARWMGYVPQGSSSTFPLTVFDVVLMGRRPYISWTAGEGDIETVSRVLKWMGIEKLAWRQFDELSGGERQKVLIARALAQESQVLLLDEPTSNLDLRHQFEVLELIKDLARRGGLSAIMAIHDLNLAFRYSDKIVMLHRGKVFAAGEPSSVLTRENIRTVYGVDVEIEGASGFFRIVPIGPIRDPPDINISGELYSK
ncbi:MAG: ABC transporter ATP-binding protein [Candidatus Latescibacterota bacterium]|nr:MAG: ABC transporter ATP-binding protein [Candidatus Latescibacterota bacterium]